MMFLELCAIVVCIIIFATIFLKKRKNRKRRERDGIICFSVTSNGRTGEEWIEYFKQERNGLSNKFKHLLRSDNFKPTSGITTKIVIIKGESFSDNKRITKNIRVKAKHFGFNNLNIENACLMSETFTTKELKDMGLSWIVIIQEPINDSDGDPDVLSVYRDDDGLRLDTYYVRPDFGWYRDLGFAFTVQQVELNS